MRTLVTSPNEAEGESINLTSRPCEIDGARYLRMPKATDALPLVLLLSLALPSFGGTVHEVELQLTEPMEISEVPSLMSKVEGTVRSLSGYTLYGGIAHKLSTEVQWGYTDLSETLRKLEEEMAMVRLLLVAGAAQQIRENGAIPPGDAEEIHRMVSELKAPPFWIIDIDIHTENLGQLRELVVHPAIFSLSVADTSKRRRRKAIEEEIKSFVWTNGAVGFICAMKYPDGRDPC